MKNWTRNSKGFSSLVVVLAVVVLAIAGGVAVYVYHRDHKTTLASSTNSTTMSNATNTTTTTPPAKTPADPYAGWVSYCDTAYHYCFKYPSTWTETVIATAKNPGESTSIEVLNPTKTVAVYYKNVDPHDSGPVTFTAVSITKLATANQDVTIVGGYTPSSGVGGNFLVSYALVDSSLLTTYPLTVGTATQFPNNPMFTDQGVGGSADKGSLQAQPAVSINTAADEQAWFANADTQTSLLILKSFYYQ